MAFIVNESSAFGQDTQSSVSSYDSSNDWNIVEENYEEQSLHGKYFQRIHHHQGTRVKSLAIHPKYTKIICGHHCGKLEVFDYIYLSSKFYNEHSGSIRAVKIHPDGKIFATAGDDKIIRIWDYKNMQVIFRLQGHLDYIRDIDFHPTLPLIVSSSDDKTIRLWNYEKGIEICSCLGHLHYIMSVAFLNTEQFVTGCLDHTMALFKINHIVLDNITVKRAIPVIGMLRVQFFNAHNKGVNCVRCIGNTVISASDDCDIKTWKSNNGLLLLHDRIVAHKSEVTSVTMVDGIIYGVGKGGVISATYQNVTERINFPTRIWSIGVKDDLLVLGTDHGLTVVDYRKMLLSDRRSSLYIFDDSVRDSLDGIRKFRIKNKTCKIKQLSSFYSENKECSMAINFSDGTYQLCQSHNKEISVEQGQAVYYDGMLFVFTDSSSLYRSGCIEPVYKMPSSSQHHKYGISATDDFIYFIEATDKKEVTLLLNSEGTFLPITCRTSYPLQFITSFSDNSILHLALVGETSIEIATIDVSSPTDKTLHVESEIQEFTFIHDALFTKYQGKWIFIYCTSKQLKYYYEGVGILTNNPFSGSCIMKQVDLNRGTLSLISHNNSVVKINEDFGLGEIRFRMAVSDTDSFDDAKVIEVIQQESLPGMSPIEHLILKHRENVAIPFITDLEKKFELLINNCNFKDSFAIAEKLNKDILYRKLYQRILSHGFTDDRESQASLQIGELCLEKLNDEKDLFYFYMFSKQFNKLKNYCFSSPIVSNLVKIVLEDETLLIPEGKSELVSAISDMKTSTKNSLPSSDVSSSSDLSKDTHESMTKQKQSSNSASSITGKDEKKKTFKKQKSRRNKN